MSVICPNLSNPDVAREFNELKAATNERAAYAIWSLNNGNGIDKAPNGAKSKLFSDFLEHYGDKTKAIQAKAKTYGKSFREWFGDWTGEDKSNVSKVVDENGEPLVVWHGGAKDIKIFSKSKDGFYYFANNSNVAEAYAEEMAEHAMNEYGDKNPNSIIEDLKKIYYSRQIYPVFLNIKNPSKNKGVIQDKNITDIIEDNNDGAIIYAVGYPMWESPNAEKPRHKLIIDALNKVDGNFEKLDTSLGEQQFVVRNSNQIKHVDNVGTYQESNDDIYDDYRSIAEINHYDNDVDSFVVDQIIKAKQENPDADILEVVNQAKREWIDKRQKDILNDTQQKLANAYGLKQEIGEDGRIRFVSISNDEDSQLIVDFLDYISGDTEGYYDHNSKSVAGHHVIAISLTNGDPSTFSHELAHHYVRMFWRSKLIQTALRAVDKPGMTDEEREEALVDIITARTNDSEFLSSVESESFVQKFWGALANMLYRVFGIENEAIRNALYRNITKAFILNEKQNTVERQSRVFAMADKRMFKKNEYREKLKSAREEARRNKSTVAYEQVGRDKAQKAIKSIVQGSISRNKNFRKSNINNAKILVDMQIAEDTVRKFVDDINEYRKNFLSSLGITKRPTSKQRKDSTYTPQELNANVELIRGFIEQARNELYDVSERFTSMESAKWAYYVSKEVIDPVTGESTREYLDASQIGQPGVTVTQVDFNELNDINQNVLGFYSKTIKELYDAVRSVDFKNTYGESVQQELLDQLSSINSVATGGPRILDMINDLKFCYEDAITERLHQFVTRYVNENAKNLTDEQKEKLIYSTNTWLENQNAFGDIGVTETWLGLASNSKSSLIRIMQDMIDTMSQKQDTMVNEKGFELRDLRIKAIKALDKSGMGIYGAISPFNVDKLLMEKDDDGFTGNFISPVNEGRYYHDRSNFINDLLYSKGGIQDQLRARLGDKTYELDIDKAGDPLFPEGQDDIEREYLHKINEWTDKRAVRRFTAKYYDTRIDMLSSITRKALNKVQNNINEIISACTIDGKVHTELLTRTKMMDLQRLYYAKSQLSNPFDQYGRKKPDGSEEALIAKELTEWNKWQSEHIKYKMDYDAYNEAKNNAKDPDQFERDNTYITVNPEIWEEIEKLFPKTNSQTISDLRYTRNKLISIIRTKRGLYAPRIEQVLDMNTGEIRPGYEEFWTNLKHYDELIETMKDQNKSSKWTKQQQAKYKTLMASIPIRVDLANGSSDSLFNVLQKRIKARLEAKYGKYDPRVATELISEMEKFQWTVRTQSGSMVRKGQLSIFSITQPPAVQVSLSKGLVNSTVREPIQAYSVIDPDASDSEFVDTRFDGKTGKPVQPITDKTKKSAEDVSYSNQKYKKYIENGPQELRDYYEALIETMKDSYQNIPFAGTFDGRLPQQGATTGQMFHRNKWWNIGKPIVYWFKRHFGINESDTDINIDYELRPDGTRSMNIPVRYIRRLDNSNEINSDILGTVINFYEMSLNYKNKSEAIPTFLTAIDKLESSTNNRTRQKTFLKGIVNRSFYERSRNFDINEDNLTTYTSKYVRKALKWIPGLRALTMTGLLALNWLAGLVAYLDPAVQLAVDAASGRYINMDDYISGTFKMITRLPAAICSAGKSRSYDLVSSGMLRFGLARSGANNFRNMDRSQLRRFLQNGLTMLPFSLGEHTVNAQVFCTIMQSYKYVYDKATNKASYMNRKEYYEWAQANGMSITKAKIKFATLPTLFSAYHTDKKGNFVPKNNKYGAAITPEFEDALGKRMRNRATVTNLIVPGNERTKIQSNIITAFTVVMRTFMLVGISERFRSLRDFQIEDDSPIDETRQSEVKAQLKKEYRGDKGGYNFQTGEIEDGIMAGAWHALGNLSGTLRYLFYSLKHPFRSRYNEKTKDFMESNKIPESDLYALDRIVTELAAIALLATIQIVFHNTMVDDEDDDKYWYQVIDHILIRLAIVRYTWFDANTFMDLVNSITPSKSDIDKKLKFIDLVKDAYQGFEEHGNQWENWEKVKSGGYKNTPKAFRDLLQTFSSVGLHNLYTSKSTEGVKSKTKWFKKMVWWEGYWHDAKSGAKPSGKPSGRRKKIKYQFDDLSGLGNPNQFDDLEGLGDPGQNQFGGF